MSSLTILFGKTVRYLHSNGILPTIRKVLRRLQGKNWISAEEDKLYIQSPCCIASNELWEMPEDCIPFESKVSVIIPTFNGAHELPALIEALQSQASINDLEIIIVDSGSTDGTTELVTTYGVKLIQISQAQFSHSYSRMLGASAATGEYLLFMTQDALPDRKDWIIRMLQPCLISGAAAVSCYETPKSDADLLSHITVWNWKNVMSGGADKLTALPDDTSYDSLRRSAQLSDNACLVKRDIYMKLGGHRGAYAEDLDLGIRLLKSGYKLGILSSICVVHSHNRPAVYNFKRAIVDGINIARIFDDFTLDHIGVSQAISRVFTAACTNRLFVRVLSQHNVPEQSPKEFAEWTRNEYNRIIIELKSTNKQKIETLLLTEGDDIDFSVRSFIVPLWQEYSMDYKFDGVLAATQARYIMHTVCPYLETIGKCIDKNMRDEICHIIWQYFGQSAGYTIAAAYLNPSVSDSRIKETVRIYSTGV